VRDRDSEPLVRRPRVRAVSTRPRAALSLSKGRRAGKGKAPRPPTAAGLEWRSRNRSRLPWPEPAESSLDGQGAGRGCLDTQYGERWRSADANCRDDGRCRASGRRADKKSRYRGRRGELDGASRRRRRVRRLDVAARARGTQARRIGCLWPVAAARRRRLVTWEHRAAVAKAQPGRGVYQRQGQYRDANGPEQRLHEVCTRMTRQRAEMQAGRPLTSRPAMRARGASPVAVPLRGTRSHLSLGRSLRATRRGRRCRPRLPTIPSRLSPLSPIP